VACRSAINTRELARPGCAGAASGLRHIHTAGEQPKRRSGAGLRVASMPSRRYGAALWQTALDEAKQSGCSAVRVTTNNHTPAAARERLFRNRECVRTRAVEIALSRPDTVQQGGGRTLPEGFTLVPIDVESATDGQLECLVRLRRLVAIEYGRPAADESVPSTALIRRVAAIRRRLGFSTHVVLLCKRDLICGYAEYCVDACMPGLLKREGRAVSPEMRGVAAARALLAAEAFVCHTTSLTMLMATSHGSLRTSNAEPIADRLTETSWRIAV